MNRAALSASKDKGFPTEPLTWKRLGGDLAAVCENGHFAFLDHDVDDEGYVTPSLECPEPDCDWHVYALLVDWQK